jgi:hypothetical protein
MFNDFIKWIKAYIKTKTARSLNTYMDLEDLKVLEISNPQTLYNKFSHLYN